MKIAVIGAGPAGLYVSMLVKKQRPDWSVVVLEQNAPSATFGWGVVLADTGLNKLRQADAATHDTLVAMMVFNDRQALVHEQTSIFIKRPKLGGAISRIDLLSVLQAAARDAGVEIRYNARLASLTDLTQHCLADAEVVVGADGINSIVRGALETEFGTRRRILNNRFAWFGTERVFANPALVFRKHGAGGVVAHYYPYSKTHSTFVGEFDAHAWASLGMEAMSDAERQTLTESIYAHELGGHRLISNAAPGISPWRRFPAITNERSISGRYVLVGDAQASAHFSIGSGTRIAMEDAIALATALVDDAHPVSERLQRFEATRGPEKAKWISASEKSYEWYERVGDWIEQYSPEDFVYNFMTRTGRVDDARLAAQFPELMARLGRVPGASR
jgi:2-polyprenyl-6-methoxyphenol hydroxylase-like FAD-dependent oxidoreductase